MLKLGFDCQVQASTHRSPCKLLYGEQPQHHRAQAVSRRLRALPHLPAALLSPTSKENTWETRVVLKDAPDALADFEAMQVASESGV
jgi:hypothetical protein